MGKDADDGEKFIKTTLRLPHALWLKARTRALQDGVSFQDLLLEGLEMRLKSGGKPSQKGKPS